MKTRYTTLSGTRYIIDHEEFTWKREGTNLDETRTNEGSFIRMYLKPVTNVMILECPPLHDDKSVRIIETTPVIAREDWYDHTHRFDIMGMYKSRNWDTQGWFCICGRRMDELEEPVPKQMDIAGWPPIRMDPITPEIKLLAPSTTKKPKFGVKKDEVVAVTPVPTIPRRFQPTHVPKDSPIATSIHGVKSHA